ncbi:MAG: FAD-binding oxidoreductase, partial [Bdellovibrionales bacterium]|nr:FAD-binding oxidoreductase [Bdellovibrionales bacterium]
SVLQKMLGVPNPKSRVIARSEAVQLLPALEEYSFTHALYWEDGLVTCPDELANVLKREIEDSGGEVFEDCQVNSVSRCDGGFLTKVNSVKDFTRKSKFVLNLSGIGSNEIELLQIKRSPFPRFWCRAFNLEIEQLIDPKVALGVQSPSGRLFFVVPRGSRSVIGTGYLPFDQGASQLALSEKEISGFLSDFNAAFPGKTFASSDVSSIDIGLLPASRIDEGEVALYGAKKVFEDRGYFEVMSTKYTTFLSQANALVQRVNKLATEVR